MRELSDSVRLCSISLECLKASPDICAGGSLCIYLLHQKASAKPPTPSPHPILIFFFSPEGVKTAFPQVYLHVCNDFLLFKVLSWAKSDNIELWNHCFWKAHTPVEGRAQSGCCNHVTPPHFCQFLPEKCWLCFLSGFDIFRSRCCCSLWVGHEAADICLCL